MKDYYYSCSLVYTGEVVLYDMKGEEEKYYKCCNDQ